MEMEASHTTFFDELPEGHAAASGLPHIQMSVEVEADGLAFQPQSTQNAADEREGEIVPSADSDRKKPRFYKCLGAVAHTLVCCGESLSVVSGCREYIACVVHRRPVPASGLCDPVTTQRFTEHAGATRGPGSPIVQTHAKIVG